MHSRELKMVAHSIDRLVMVIVEMVTEVYCIASVFFLEICVGHGEGVGYVFRMALR